MKKYFKTLSIIIVVALTFTSVGFANLSQVYAKSAVKSVKVKKAKKKMTLKVGETKVFKVKVKAKKGKTKFTVKSSNKKVVKAVKKGKKITLTALKVGKAKVIVRSKANKKKKFVININVIANGSTETSKAKETTKAIQPTTKATEPTTEPVVEPTTVAPTEAPTAEPTQAPTDAPTEGPTAEPTTAAPTQAPTETPTAAPTTVAPTEGPTEASTAEPTTETPTTEVPTTEEETGEYDYEAPVKAVAGEEIEDTAYLGWDLEEPEVTGMDNCPEGVTCKTHENPWGYYELVFSGIINDVGEYKIIVYLKDKDGEKYTCLVTVYVVDENTVYAESLESISWVYAKEEIWAEGNISTRIFGAEDDEEYAFRILEDENNVFAVSNEGYPTISYFIKQVGEFTATAQVYNKNNPNVNYIFKCKVSVTQMVRVTGTVTSNDGTQIWGAGMWCEEEYNPYPPKTDENGKYVMNFIKPGVYSIYAYYDGEVSEVKKINLQSDMDGVDFVISGKYTVSITSSMMDSARFGYWSGDYRDKDGNVSGVGYDGGNKILVSAGEYELYTEGYAAINHKYCSYEAKLDINVTDNMEAEAEITKTTELPLEGELVEGTNTVKISSNHKVYKFVPTTTGKYYFASKYDHIDTKIALYDSEFNLIDENDNEKEIDWESGNYDFNFGLKTNLEAGKTYYAVLSSGYTAQGDVEISLVE